MKSQRSLASRITLISMLVLILGLSQAQPLGAHQVAVPQAAVGNAITYQGSLSDGGEPANGEYDFRFALYDALTGGAPVGSTVAANDVIVTDGLFTVALDFGSVFDGTGLWLEAAVRPGSSTGAYTTLSPRQEMTPAPYALSLKPGARIQTSGNSAILGGSDAGVYGETYSGSGAGIYGVASYTGPMCAIWPLVQQSGGYFESKAAGCGYGVYGKGNIGVYGQSDASGGYGGFFRNTAGGVDIAAIGSGTIKSTADTRIVISPLNMVADYNAADAPILYPNDAGYVVVRHVVAGTTQAFLPTNVPSAVFGVPQKLKSVRVCYWNVSNSAITGTEVYYTSDTGVRTSLINDSTQRWATSWACYTVNAPSPGLIQGPVYVLFRLYALSPGGATDTVIGNVTLTLTEN